MDSTGLLARGDPLLATVTRSGQVESWHRGVVVVADRERVVRAFGDPATPVYARSATKPLQALPLVERGVARALALGAPELALVCASHNGTPAHLAVVAGILARGGFTEADLQCGPHAPFDGETARALVRAGTAPGRAHNNCSGKHAGFLCLAGSLGVAKAEYLDPGSESQRVVRRTVAEMAGLAEDDLGVGLDGCGAPTFRLPLGALAMAFARLSNPRDLGSVRAAACRELLSGITECPILLAGAGRLCTALVQSLPGGILPKNGAEGVYAFGLPGRDLGVAVKVSDGSERAYLPVVIGALQALGVWREPPAELADFARVPLRNTRKQLVGHVESVLQW